MLRQKSQLEVTNKKAISMNKYQQVIDFIEYSSIKMNLI